MLHATNVAEKLNLKVHPVLVYLTLDGVVTFTWHLSASHLRVKHNILQPQPISESNPSIALPFCLNLLYIFLELLSEFPLML